MIAVTGTIQTRNYTDRDGNNRTITEVAANLVDFGGDKDASRQEENDSEQFEEYEDISGQDLPF